MHGFINSPALAKLVAMQMVDEQLQQTRRPRKARTSLRTRFLVRRTSSSSATPVKGQRVRPTGTLAEEGR
jgi:hypothetical protein